MRRLAARALAHAQVARRLGWGVADQAISSLENFLLGAYVARTMGAESLGALGLGFLAYSVVLNCSRAVSTDPLAVRFSGPPDARWRGAVAASGGTALLVGVVGGLACIGLGSLLDGEARAAFVSFGVVLPALTLQDSWRYAFFAAGRGAWTFLNDTVWTVLLVVTLFVGDDAGASGLAWAVLAFGATAAMASALGMLQAGLLPRPREAGEWLVRHRDLGSRFLVENVTLGAGGQIRSVIVAGTGGLRAVGSIRGAEMLIGPIAALLMGVSQVAVPEAVRARKRGPRALRILCLGLSAGLASMALAWGLIVLLVFPHGIGEAILGSVWPSAHALVLGVMVSATAGCLHVGPSAGLRALGRADKTMRSQLAVTSLFILIGGVGAALWSAQGAVWGTALASILGAVIWWSQLVRAQREEAAVALTVPAVPTGIEFVADDGTAR